MRTDGLFDFRVVHIPAKYGETIRIIPIGDVHFNSPAFARERWQEDVELWKKYTKQGNTFFLTTGDIFESLSTSERKTYTCGEFHDSSRTRWEKEYAKEIKDFTKEISFAVGKTLAVFGGNHYFKFWDGTTSEMALASELKSPYVGSSGYLILVLDIDKHHSHALKIFVHHGRSSGRRAGSSFNAIEDAASYFTDADIVLMGHDHKAGAMTLPALRCDMGRGGNWKIKAFDRIIARTGSYLKSYEPGTNSYAHDAMYRPSTLGSLELLITPTRYSYKEKGIDDRGIKIKAVL